jgi:predicted MFS family arabinose efflux permease
VEHPILTVLRLPGAARAFLPSLIGRLSLAMAVLAIVLAVQRATGSFTAAGAASGFFGFANVVAAPWRARVIGRWGQRRALIPLSLIQAASYLGLALATHASATPAPVFLGLSAAAGLAAPPLGAAMRAAWTRVTSPGDQRTHALSLDATADEAVFIVGPVVAASLSAAFSPSSALLAAAIALLIGTLGLTTSQVAGTLRGRDHEPEADAGTRALRFPGFVRVLVVLFGVGVVLGTIEVVAPAVAVADHHRGASGWLLAALSLGSALGGLAYGHAAWRSALSSRMLFAAATMGALTCATAFLTTVLGFALGAVAIGLLLAPSIVTGYLAAEVLVPPHAALEASIWTNTALNLGAAISNASAGALVTNVGTTSAMVLAAAVVTAASACTPRAHLIQRSTRRPPT